MADVPGREEGKQYAGPMEIDLAATMDYAFEFKVGDVVQPKALGVYCEKPSGYGTSSREGVSPWYSVTMTNSHSVRYQVVERLLQQCHGGIQKLYRLRLVDNRGVMDKGFFDITEPELTASAPYREIRSMSKASLKKWVDGLPEDGQPEELL